MVVSNEKVCKLVANLDNIRETLQSKWLKSHSHAHIVFSVATAVDKPDRVYQTHSTPVVAINLPL